MTCTELKVAPEGPTAELGREGYKYTVPLLVHTNDLRDGPKIVGDYVQAAWAPLGTPYGCLNDTDVTSFLDSITPTRVVGSPSDHGAWWGVALKYSPLDKDEEKPDKEGKPTKEPTQWRQEHNMGFASWQVPVWKANNLTDFPHPDATVTAVTPYTRPAGTVGPIVNSAGVVLDPTLMTDEHDLVWQVTAYDEEYAADDSVTFQGMLNLQPVQFHNELLKVYGFKQVAAPFVQFGWKCTNYSASCRYANGKTYWHYSLEFRYRKSTWIQEVLDRGIAARGAAGGATGTGNQMPGTAATGSAPAMPVLDGIGRRVPEPVLFDGAGLPLAAGASREAQGFYFRWLIEGGGFGAVPFSAIPHKLFKV
jgi:hypothetical protein